jgi:hypothetical protein
MFQDFMFHALFYGYSQMPVRIVLNFHLLYFFPQLAHHFYRPGYENLPDFTVSSSVLGIYFLRHGLSSLSTVGNV